MQAADRIRNVALVGHRGSGKTSLHEALLHEAGATTRLGSVADGTTVSDADDDEKARGMSISASLASFEWRDVKVNLIDTPGEPSFIADALGALRVCESAVFVVNGVLGVEVGTQRLWQRAQELGVARLVYVNMLDRERADFFRTLDALKDAFGPHVVATEIPIGSEHEVRGLVDLVDMKAFEYEDASRDGVKEGDVPDDLEDLPSPAMRGAVEAGDAVLEPDPSADVVAFVFKTLADPFAGRINLFRVYQGVLRADSQAFNCRAHTKERLGQLLVP